MPGTVPSALHTLFLQFLAQPDGAQLALSLFYNGGHLRIRGRMSLGQSHRASKWQIQNSVQAGILAPGAKCHLADHG